MLSRIYVFTGCREAYMDSDNKSDIMLKGMRFLIAAGLAAGAIIAAVVLL